MRIGNDTVLIGLRFKDTNRIDEGRWDCQMIVAVDRRTGAQLWALEAEERFGAAAFAMASQRVANVASKTSRKLLSGISVFQ